MAKILLVDDDDIILELMETVLTVKGYRSARAGDGETAMAMALEQDFDLIITDLNLPKITGWDLIKKLRGAEETKTTPIVALSAHSDADDRDAAHSAGCNAYVAKPISPEDVINTIDSIFKV